MGWRVIVCVYMYFCMYVWKRIGDVAEVALAGRSVGS